MAALVLVAGLGPVGAVSGGVHAQAPPASPDRQTPPARGLRETRVFPWWKDAEIQRELGLSDEKVRRIDEIYQSRVRQWMPYQEELQRQLAELDRMTTERVADESAYELKVSQVEALRSKINESRTVMLYKMSRQLDPVQYQKLIDIFRRRDPAASRGRGDSRR